MNGTFVETHIVMKGKNPEVKEEETIVKKTHFKAEVPTYKTIDEDENKVLTSSYSKGKSTISPNYKLTHDIVRREFVPPQSDDFSNLICYALNCKTQNQRSSWKRLKVKVVKYV